MKVLWPSKVKPNFCVTKGGSGHDFGFALKYFQSCFSLPSLVHIGKFQCPSLREILEFFKTLLTLNLSVLLRGVM